MDTQLNERFRDHSYALAKRDLSIERDWRTGFPVEKPIAPPDGDGRIWRVQKNPALLTWEVVEYFAPGKHPILGGQHRNLKIPARRWVTALTLCGILEIKYSNLRYQITHRTWISNDRDDPAVRRTTTGNYYDAGVIYVARAIYSYDRNYVFDLEDDAIA